MAGGEEFRSSYIANCVLNGFLCPTAILLNSITIFAIRRTSSLPNTLKTLLLSLAASDLGVGLLAQPLDIALLVMKSKQITENDPVFNATFLASLLSTNVFVFASFFGVMALSVDRFLAIHLHLRYQELVTHKRVVAVVISIWVFSVAPSVFRLWMPVNITYVIGSIICVACMVAATFLNYKIYMAVRRHAHQIQALQVHQAAQNVQVANLGTLRKSAVTSIYIYMVFLLCYLPNSCILCISVITSHPMNAVIQSFTVTIVFLNSSLNPLIYCLKMKHIRHAIINIMRSTFCTS